MQKSDIQMREQERILESVLTKDPEYSLTAGFADRILAKTRKKLLWNQYLREFYIYLGANAGILMVLVGIALIWFQEDLDSWINFLVTRISWIVGIQIVLIFILFIDRVLLPYSMDLRRGQHYSAI